ncbi:GM20731 [Drosophila sechellia]|uniref:GM20731 n=1 Tax=Drosophila sechellia TaxID=7238 RepID=B4HRI0_DROSE|nr:GM20731 [Drosophila sechellia]
MSHLLRRTKKSCLKFLRKISTSKQLFVQRLDEEDGDDEEVEEELNLQRDLGAGCEQQLSGHGGHLRGAAAE